MFDLPNHPRIVHLPVGVALIVPWVLIGLLIAIQRDRLPPRAWWLGVVLSVVVALGALLAQQTGGDDAELVKSIVPKAALREHARAAQIFVYLSGLTALLAVAAVFLREPRQRSWGYAVSAAAALLTLGSAIRTGHLGGELVYRHGAAAAHTSGEHSAPTEGVPTPRKKPD